MMLSHTRQSENHSRELHQTHDAITHKAVATPDPCRRSVQGVKAHETAEDTNVMRHTDMNAMRGATAHQTSAVGVVQCWLHVQT